MHDEIYKIKFSNGDWYQYCIPDEYEISYGTIFTNKEKAMRKISDFNKNVYLRQKNITAELKTFILKERIE